MELYAGADDYLDLPFRNEELLAKVARSSSAIARPRR